MPLAIQLAALRMGDAISLVCVKVLDEMRLGMVDEDEEVQAVADRSYWEARATKDTLAMVDEMLQVVRTLDPQLDLKYNKFYIGLAKNGQPNNFVIFKPKKGWLRLEVCVDRSDEIQAQLDAAGVDVMDYDAQRGRYRIRLANGDTAKHKGVLATLIEKAFRAAE
jgi:predicted transport protein